MGRGRTVAARTASAEDDTTANEVRLVGRVAAPAQERILPSGDRVSTLRVIVDRPAAAVRGTSRVDTVDCAVWAARLRRSVTRWSAGDVVEVHGALRRRFYRVGGATTSRVEIELASGRIIRRAASG